MNSNQFSTLFAALSTLIAAIISGIISFLVCKWQLAKQNISSEEARLNSELNNILKIQIKYPYLENRYFVDGWCSSKVIGNDEKSLDYQRYDSYCCMLFDFLSQIFLLYKGDNSKIENFFAVEEEVNIHKKWWQNPLNPRDNIEGFNGDFRDYINSVIARSKK
ncbi:MAG: hypothetical protein LBC76_07890 [Treponema sp.]|jgi:hypothetical protein|nr:hypothetical protein [Treponema sp.]